MKVKFSKDFARRKLAWIMGLLAAASYDVQYALSEQLPTWLHWTLLGIGTLATLAAVAAPEAEVRRALSVFDSAQTAVAQAQFQASDAAHVQRVVLENHLSPVAALLGRIAAERSGRVRIRYQQQMKQLIADAVVFTFREREVRQVRACFLEYAPEDSDGPRRLEWRNVRAGRHTEPRTLFHQGTEPGNSMLALLDARESCFYANVDEEPPPAWKNNRPYKTFINASVAIDGVEPFGLLTVDSLTSGDLEEDDKAFIEILALILAAALAIGN